jgi:hypothetical protein
MAIGFKTLILIDNSRSVGEANFTLCKETARYLVTHMNEADSVRIATFGEGIEYITDYTTDTALLTGGIEKLERVERDTYITDNLAEIIMDWNKQDVACRNIILFTDGEENEPVKHADEELYYLAREAGYPVYVVQSVENKGIPASKNLSAVATLSGGELLLTEFEGSEGGSEQIMGDRILKAIDSARISAETGDGYEETSLSAAYDESTAETAHTSVGLSETAENEETSEILFIENSTEKASSPGMTGDAGFGTADNKPIIRGGADGDSGFISLNVLLPAAGLAAAVLFALIVFRIIRRNRIRDKRPGRLLNPNDEELKIEAGIAEAAEDYDCLTYKLDEYCNATRLLDQEENGRNIVLEDCSDPTKLYRAMCDDSLIVGRSGNLCDIVIDNDDSVSGRHCELTLRGDNWYIRDLRSSNGTRVNAQKVFQELLLKNGDIVQLGQSALQVRI